MCPSCPVNSSPCYLCGTYHGSANRSLVTLPGMPNDVLVHVIRFHPDSARILRIVSKKFEEASKEFLRWHAQEIFASSSLARASPLHSLICSRYSPDNSPLQFLVFLPEIMRALGIQCPDRILSLEEIAQCDPEVQEIQDVNLQRTWEPLRSALVLIHPQLRGVPGSNASAPAIRSWLHVDAHQLALQSVTRLDLSNRDLTIVPPEIRLCTGLRELILDNNSLTFLPEDSFQGLSRLLWLSLSHNQLVTLPNNLFRGLSNLQRLELLDNRLASLPEETFQGLEELWWLDLSRNELVSLPEGLFREPTGLQRLDLSNNRLTSVSWRLFRELADLKRLLLSGNALTSLPEDLFQELENLEGLTLCGNQLTSLPGDLFRGLGKLLDLRFSTNQLASLPEDLLQGLTKLQHLDLANNQLASLPGNLFRGLTELQGLNLRFGNPHLLFFSHRSTPARPDENDILYLIKIHQFFQYPCQSAFATFYQLAAGNSSSEILQGPLLQLPDRIKNRIFGIVWEEAGRPLIGDPQWGEHHALDNIRIFHTALQRVVSESVRSLNQQQKFDNILRLIDALQNIHL